MENKTTQDASSAQELQARWEDAIERAAEQKPRPQELDQETQRASAGLRLKRPFDPPQATESGDLIMGPAGFAH